jgi:chemotaxis protein histidine kinase CheA/ActR/RegA family two-component response regulator
MSNTFDKPSVLDSFIEEVNSYLPEIETNLDKLTHSPSDMDALEETYRRSHTIGGSASMMDFPGMAHVAHGMEDILGDALDGLTTLDESTIGLLRRSLGRLHRLVEGIRTGVDEGSIIAEDDADYAQYRAKIEPSLQEAQPPAETTSFANEQPPQEEEVTQTFASPGSSPMPSFEEVLASFRTPSVPSGEDVGWPEDAVPSTNEQQNDALMSQPYPAAPEGFLPTSETNTPPASSAWDELVNTARRASVPPSQPPEKTVDEYSSYEAATQMPSYDMPTQQYTMQQGEVYPQFSEGQEQEQTQLYSGGGAQQTWASEIPENEILWPPEPVDNRWPSQQLSQYAPESGQQEPALDEQSAHFFVPETPQQAALDRWQPNVPAVDTEGMPPSYAVARQNAQALEEQAAALKNIAAQLHMAMSLIEAQRSEFKGFLDGSKDALDRMEDWAGQAMGLNLRNSPEQVRRYLPLSVMWVTNSKLKKLLEQLSPIVGSVEVTDERFAAVFQQLHNALATFAQEFQRSQTFTQERGWSPWEMQGVRDEDNVRERITFERHGDPTALRAEIEAQVRSELEQQIREEVRRELEEEMARPSSGPLSHFSIKDVEAKLRSEIEIQVRRDFLNQLAQSAEVAQTLMQRGGEANAVERTISQPMSSRSPAPSPASSAAPSASTSSAANEFGDEAVEIFRAEAEEHLQTISMCVADLEKDSTNRELIQSIRRATHTLKGAAGMMGFHPIADLCHISEDLLDSIMDGTTSITSDALSLIFDTAEALDVLITGRSNDNLSDEERVQVLRQRYVELLGEHAASASAGSLEEALASDIADDHLDDHAQAATDVVVGQDAAAPRMQQSGARGGDLTVRVRLPKLDELVNLFGEVLVNRSVLEERMQRLARLIADVGVSSNRLREVGQKLENRFEAVMLPSGRTMQSFAGDTNSGQNLLLSAPPSQNGGRTYLSEFDELELDRYTEFHQIARGLSESVSDMGTLSTEMDALIRESESILMRENRLNTSFQDRLMKIRLVPLSNMKPRLYRTAYSVALKQHKEIEFVFEGEEIEVDRTVFEEIAGPLLHLIRNAVNHAIEAPQIRTQKGKSATGLINVQASYEGNQIVITVRDDGTGIDTESVRRTAISRGLIRPEQSLSESDLINLIFRPGFSTAGVLSEESGRGVGLDVVRDSVSRLRGTLIVETTPGQGTAFTMTFPTSLAIQSVMVVRVGNQQFAIPTVAVEAIGRYDNFKHTTLSGQPAVVVSNETYPLHALAQYLNLPAHSLEERSQLLLVNAAGNRIALVVDEIKGKSDIVMKNLGPHLRQVQGIAGGTILGNGRVMLVLELSDLLSGPSYVGSREMRGSTTTQSLFRQQVNMTMPQQSTAASMSYGGSAPAVAERGKHILVVDDSPSVRRVVSSMLKQHGWEVQTARDGVEALEMVSYETPAAVLLDIEMPRMDGYELISTIRAQEQYRSLPLVVLTSRAAAKHQQRAMSLGASAYVVKPYQDEALVNLLKGLVYGAEVHR